MQERRGKQWASDVLFTAWHASERSQTKGFAKVICRLIARCQWREFDGTLLHMLGGNGRRLEHDAECSLAQWLEPAVKNERARLVFNVLGRAKRR